MAAALDDDRCYAAMQGRDARFDGWFVVAVSSTHIYCRPSCPARTPKRANVSFYPTAAAAQAGGYRACRRCRPDASPGAPGWRGRSDVAARAMQLVLDGVVDRDGVAGLASRLGYSERQLHRVLVAELGASAVALARAQRAQTARILIETSTLPVTAVAFAAGFASVRQFNETIRQVYACTPTTMRRRAQRRTGPGGTLRAGALRPSAHAATGAASSHAAAGHAGAAGAVEINLRLPYRSPMAAGELIAFLAARGVPEIEVAEEGSYRRSLALPHGQGTVLLRPVPGHVGARFRLSDLRDLPSAVSCCRHLLNLDADPVVIDDALLADPTMAPLVRRRPGLRVPGCVDGFEIAVRAVLGQQVSVAAARRALGRLIAACDRQLDRDLREEHGPALLFPTPEQVAELVASRPALLGLPGTRCDALGELAGAAASGRLVLGAGADPEEVRRRLLECRGIGSWTAEYVAMRAVGDPDAFLAGDSGACRGATWLDLPCSGAELAQRAERWRPWRAHAEMHLWAAASEPRRRNHEDVTERETRRGSAA